MERNLHAREWVIEAGKLLYLIGTDPLDVAEKKSHQDIVTKWDKQIEQLFRENIRNAYPQDEVIGEEFSGLEILEKGKPGVKTKQTEWIWYIDPIDGTANFANQRCNYAISVGIASGGSIQCGIVLDVVQEKLYYAVKNQGAWMEKVHLDGAEVCSNKESVTESGNKLPMKVSSHRNIKNMFLTLPSITDIYLKEYKYKDGMLRLSKDVRAVRGLGSVALELCQVAEGKAELSIALSSCPWDHNAARLILTEAGGYICRMNGEKLPLDVKSDYLAGNSVETVEGIRKTYF